MLFLSSNIGNSQFAKIINLFIQILLGSCFNFIRYYMYLKNINLQILFDDKIIYY